MVGPEALWEVGVLTVSFISISAELNTLNGNGMWKQSKGNVINCL